MPPDKCMKSVRFCSAGLPRPSRDGQVGIVRFRSRPAPLEPAPSHNRLKKPQMGTRRKAKLGAVRRSKELR